MIQLRKSLALCLLALSVAIPNGSAMYNGVSSNGNIGSTSPNSDSFYTGNIIGSAFGGYYEGLGGGASITANTYTFGGSDYLGLTNSSQYQGAAYDFSRISSTIARETTITVATLGAGTVVQAGRGGFALNSAYNLGRGYEAFNAGYDLTNSGVDAYHGNYGSAALNLTTGTLGAVGGFGRVDIPSGTPQHVFWSGGDAAENAARNFARNNGGIIIGDTSAGRALAQSTDGLPWSQVRPQWLSLSEDFARGASGEINVFQNARGLSLDSIWRDEFRILQQNSNVTRINYNIVMPDTSVVPLP